MTEEGQSEETGLLVAAHYSNRRSRSRPQAAEAAGGGGGGGRPRFPRPRAGRSSTRQTARPTRHRLRPAAAGREPGADDRDDQGRRVHARAARLEGRRVHDRLPVLRRLDRAGGEWDSAKCSANARAYAQQQVGDRPHRDVQLGLREARDPDREPRSGWSARDGQPGEHVSGPDDQRPRHRGRASRTTTTRPASATTPASCWNDQFQGAADAQFAQGPGLKKVYVLTDKETYGQGIATLFGRSARSSASRSPAQGAGTRTRRATTRSRPRSSSPARTRSSSAASSATTAAS